MCPHCGRLFKPEEVAGLIPVHTWHPPIWPECPGSLQNPRNPETDRRRLWDGSENPHLEPELGGEA